MRQNKGAADEDNGAQKPDGPVVSVVIPLYNKEKEVERAIRSVQAQTFEDFEIVVVNDGSSDRGAEIVSAIEEPRLRLFHQENQGVSAARNRGIAEARADLIAFLDADDEWMPEFLETIMRLRADYPECAVFATGYLYRYPDGSDRRPSLKGIPPEPWQGVLDNYFRVAARSDPPLCSSAVAATKAALNSVGRFPVGTENGEDLLTWARLAVHFELAYSNLPAAIFRKKWCLWEKPTRAPDDQDVVGSELRSLMKRAPNHKTRGLKVYTGLWHRMRASSYLRLGQRRDTVREATKALRYQPWNTKILVLGALALFAPRRLIRAIFRLTDPDLSRRRTWCSSVHG